MANAPDANKILSTLIELFADQYGVKIIYEIEERSKDGHENHRFQWEAKTPTTEVAKRKPDSGSIRHAVGAI